ncbi:MAG: hypothetical protein IPM75_14655 [Candidatus Competibacteraceae bacterium]|nr:hypothetical protein [Candidatus Competibacteraceae bacterium]
MLEQRQQSDGETFLLGSGVLVGGDFLIARAGRSLIGDGGTQSSARLRLLVGAVAAINPLSMTFGGKHFQF